jgi:hypothetical protein
MRVYQDLAEYFQIADHPATNHKSGVVKQDPSKHFVARLSFARIIR